MKVYARCEGCYLCARNPIVRQYRNINKQIQKVKSISWLPTSAVLRLCVHFFCDKSLWICCKTLFAQYIFNYYRMATTVFEDITKVHCKIFGTVVQVHMILSSGKKHLDLMSVAGNKVQGSIKYSIQPLVHDPTKIAQLKLAVFMTEHSAIIFSVDHLGELVPELDTIQIFYKNKVTPH